MNTGMLKKLVCEANILTFFSVKPTYFYGKNQQQSSNIVGSCISVSAGSIGQYRRSTLRVGRSQLKISLLVYFILLLSYSFIVDLNHYIFS